MSDAARLEVRLKPRAKRNEIAGRRDGRLLVEVTAPPVEGRANEALCKLVAKRLGLPRSRVTLVRGERTRDKVLRIDGLDDRAVHRLLSA